MISIPCSFVLPISAQNIDKRDCFCKEKRTYIIRCSVPNKIFQIASSYSSSSDFTSYIHDCKKRIVSLFSDVSLSVSPYDTAWVAMVPSLNSPGVPYFPQCLNWLLDNQFPNGSWGISQHPLMVRDTILSTLASIIALKLWDADQEHIHRGIKFIELNIAASLSQKQYSPVGFEIIVPCMLEYAKSLNLDISVGDGDLCTLKYIRDLELKNVVENYDAGNAYITYVSQGLLGVHDSKALLNYQRKNGSLFNSPSASAAVFIHSRDDKCLGYLNLLVSMFGSAVPTIYPLNIYIKLFLIDTVERLGISRYFGSEIKKSLDETYNSWMRKEEEIFLDGTTCAMAFRLLRFHGYDVSSNELSVFYEGKCSSSVNFGHFKEIETTLELFRASELAFPNDFALVKHNLQLSNIIKQGQKVHATDVYDSDSPEGEHFFFKSATDAVRFPFFANLDRFGKKRNIGHYVMDRTRVAKACYTSPVLGNEDIVRLAVEDFNGCQRLLTKELKILERWMMDNRLYHLNFARKRLIYCFLSSAAAIVPPELSEARMAWTKNGVLTTIVDDFFDVAGSREELENLIFLFEREDVNKKPDPCSQEVEIIYSAVQDNIHEIGGKAYARQGRDVTSHMGDIWLTLLKSMWKEAEWERNKSLPTVGVYTTNGYVSFALEPIVTSAMYLVGPILSEEVMKSVEFHELFRLTSTCGRLLNDVRTFRREMLDGKVNAVMLNIIHSGNTVTQAESVEQIMAIIECTRRTLLQKVLQTEGSVVPRFCKDLFWIMNKVVHYFYMKDDGYSQNDGMAGVVDDVINQPIVLSHYILE